MRIPALLISSLLLISCSNINIKGSIENKIYTSPDKEFSVQVPPFPNLGTKDTEFDNQIFVDFYMGSGYWTTFGLYTIEWLKLNKSISANDFRGVVHELSREHIEKRFGQRSTFDITDSKNIDLKEHEAYQVLAAGSLDNKNAYWICTVVNYGDRLAFISTITPLQTATGFTSMPDKLPATNYWYTNMLNSFERL